MMTPLAPDPFRRVRTPCTWCRRAVQTLAYVARPLCRGCRAKRRNLAKGPYRRRCA